MASRRKKWLARAVIAATIALVAHLAALVLFATFAGDFGGPLPNALHTAGPAPSTVASSDDQPMEIETLENQLDRPELKTPDEAKREEEAKKEEEEKNPNGQVVDIARPAIEERPDHAKFVSEYDSKVDHEMRGAHARDRAGGKEEHPDGTSVPIPASRGGEPPPGRPEAQPGRPGPLAMRDLERRSQSGESGTVDQAQELDGEMPRPGQHADGATHHAAPAQPPGDGADGQPLGMGGRPGHTGEPRPNLAPSSDALQHAIGRGNGSMDYLKDVDDGDSTALNSKKWVHAAFFNRVKRQVADQWHPEVVYVQHDPQGNVYGVKDCVTVLRVHMKPDGHLGGWTVLQSSGVDFLDDEAIHAFQHAQPFPNPPRALVETDGQIHFNFAFIFELSGRTSLKVYKY